MKFTKRHHTSISEKIEELSEYLQELFDKYHFSHVEDLAGHPALWGIESEGNYWTTTSEDLHRIKINMNPEIHKKFFIDFKKIIPYIEKRMSSKDYNYKILYDEYTPSRYVNRGAGIIWIIPTKKNLIKRFLDL